MISQRVQHIIGPAFTARSKQLLTVTDVVGREEPESSD
jgi:hypothetical protein